MIFLTSSLRIWVLISLLLIGGFSLPVRVFAAEQEPVEVAIVGRFGKGPVNAPVRVSAAEFESAFGTATPSSWIAEFQARRFFAQGGARLQVIRVQPDGALRDAIMGNASAMTGVHALPLVRDLGIVLCPEITQLPAAQIQPTLSAWNTHLSQRRATLILDPPSGMLTAQAMIQWKNQNVPSGSSRLSIYYPYLVKSIDGVSTTYGASGTMAAAWLKNDSSTGRGIWSSPAGTHVTVSADDLSLSLTTAQRDALNLEGIAPFLKSQSNIIAWGARSLHTSDPEQRYISVNRARDWIGTNVQRIGKISAASENQAALWNSLKSQTESFLQEVYLRGGLTGTTPAQAYFVSCGLGQTMTQTDVNAHQVKLQVGVALLRPSEFHILQFTWSTRGAAYPPPAPLTTLRDGVQGKQLFYYTPAGASYMAESSTSLAPTSWISQGIANIGDGTWRSIEFIPTDGRRFFRVKQTPSP